MELAPWLLHESAAWEFHFMFIYYISVFNMELGHTAPVHTASLDNGNNLYVRVILDVMACWMTSRYQILEGL